MTQLKGLYLGKSLDDLTNHFNLPEDLRKHKLPMLLKTAQKTYAKADECFAEGDQELSYIYFVRYFRLIDAIRNMPEYSDEKDYVTRMLGGNAKQTKAMDKTETLCNSLKERYEQLAESSKLIDSNSVSVDNKSDTIVSSDDVQDKKLMPIISCEDLFRMIQDPSVSLLVMDCRGKADFSASHLKYQCCMNVPEEIILSGMTAGMIQQKLEPESRALWASRFIKDHVILMDWSCEGPTPIINTPIWRLRDILLHWDPDASYRSPIKILEGGYQNFVVMYPNLCTDPNIQPPNILSSEIEMLDDIEYPSIHDITMKDDSSAGAPKVKQGNIPPSVDRSSKQTAIKTYTERQRILEILKEREMLVEKDLINEKKLLEAENNWKNVSKQMDKTEVAEQKMVLQSAEQKLLYEIMQLESKERDYKLENDRLREQIEECKRREIAMGKALSEKENMNLEQTAKRIEDKLQQRKKIDEEREKYSQERVKQLAFAREQKRHLKPPTDEDEISKPKIPQFDRSVKPQNKIIPDTTEPHISRDFSPVQGCMGRGLTGLKNLGNTCYMNSIMQCLSNTTSLAEYFITNNYKKHININSKTKGRIAEEVAALIKILWCGSYKFVASRDLRHTVGQYQQAFRGIEQQDSHEFLTILIDWLHSDLQTIVLPRAPDNLPASEKAWLEFTKSRESFILRLFYGLIKSTVKCVECGKESATYECFSNLSLELPPSNRCYLRECLDMYFHSEKIKGWNCPSCKQKRDAIKKLDISKLPSVLVIHFKRFCAEPESIGNSYKKKQSYVQFPLDKLDMTPYIARSESRTTTSKVYHLYGVSNHYGSIGSGHYTAFCKSNVFGKWFKFDDQVVSPLDPSDVVSSAAYILFYTYLPEPEV